MPIKKSFTLEKKVGAVQEEKMDEKLETLRIALENIEASQQKTSKAVRELRDNQSAVEGQLADLYYLTASNAADEEEVEEV